MSSRSRKQILGGEPPVIRDIFCFLCKDGGDDNFRAFNFRNCPKVYHPSCLESKHGFLPSPGEQFICDWHICLNCKGSSHFQCLLCPVSVCHDCIGKPEFVELKMQQKGFCSSCLNKAIFIEKDTNLDPRWKSPGLSKAETREIVFKDYWEEVNDKEHLKLDYLEEACFMLNKKLDCNREKSEKLQDEDHKLDAYVSAENAAIGKTVPFDSKGKQNVNTKQKKLLSTEAERMRLLEEVPEIIADTEQEGNETEVAASSTSQGNREENILKCVRIIEEKPTKGNKNTLLLPVSPGVTQGTSSSNDLQVQRVKGATEHAIQSLRVHKEKQTEAAEAHHRSVTLPDSVLHSQTHNTQDGSSTEAMNIDKDDSKHSRRKNNGGSNIEEAINLDSDKDEDTLLHNPEGKASDALRAVSGGYPQQPKSASTIQLDAQGATRGHIDLNSEQQAAVRASTNKESPLTPLWNYVDPQGNTRGPFPLKSLFHWSGFFDKNLKVWRTRETMEQAILLTDAFVMDLQCGLSFEP